MHRVINKRTVLRRGLERSGRAVALAVAFTQCFEVHGRVAADELAPMVLPRGASSEAVEEDALWDVEAGLAKDPNDASPHLQRSAVLADRATDLAREAGTSPDAWSRVAEELEAAASASERYAGLVENEEEQRRESQRAVALRDRADHARATAHRLSVLSVPPPKAGRVLGAPQLQVDFIDRPVQHRRRLALGGTLVAAGVAGAIASLTLTSGTVGLRYPSGCSSEMPLACGGLTVDVEASRIGAGLGIGLASAILNGVGAGLLMRTPRRGEQEISRKRSTTGRSIGATMIVGGLGMLATAGGLATRHMLGYGAAAGFDEGDARQAVSSANILLTVAVAGIIAIGLGAGVAGFRGSSRRQRRGVRETRFADLREAGDRRCQ